MKNFLIQSLRIISYILLPVGSNAALWETNLAKQIAIIVALLVFPIPIIFFLYPQEENRAIENTSAVSKKWFRVIQKPTRKGFFLNLIAIIALIIIGLLPLILWTVVVLMVTHPNPFCSKVHLLDIISLFYCILRR